MSLTPLSPNPNVSWINQQYIEARHKLSEEYKFKIAALLAEYNRQLHIIEQNHEFVIRQLQPKAIQPSSQKTAEIDGRFDIDIDLAMNEIEIPSSEITSSNSTPNSNNLLQQPSQITINTDDEKRNSLLNICPTTNNPSLNIPELQPSSSSSSLLLNNSNMIPTSIPTFNPTSSITTNGAIFELPKYIPVQPLPTSSAVDIVPECEKSLNESVIESSNVLLEQKSENMNICETEERNVNFMENNVLEENKSYFL